MATETLTRERILEAAEDVLRRYGPAKANVVDVARALRVSHGDRLPPLSEQGSASRRRHRALAREHRNPRSDRGRKGTAPQRLERWLDSLVQAKRRKALDDPELFATYIELATDAREVVRTHVQTLVDQLARIVADGVADSAFTADDPKAAARAAFDATSRFHNRARGRMGRPADRLCVRRSSLSRRPGPGRLRRGAAERQPRDARASGHPGTTELTVMRRCPSRWVASASHGRKRASSSGWGS